MGKGSAPRPFAVSNQEYQNRWDAIFGRDNDQEKNKTQDLGASGSNPTRLDRGSNNTTKDSGQAPLP